MNGILLYLLAGLVWSLLNEGNIQSNGHRTRLIFFWPITLIAFIIGFIEAVINQNNKDEEM